jgi:hypothetical protein
MVPRGFNALIAFMVVVFCSTLPRDSAGYMPSFSAFRRAAKPLHAWRNPHSDVGTNPRQSPSTPQKHQERLHQIRRGNYEWKAKFCKGKLMNSFDSLQVHIGCLSSFSLPRVEGKTEF